jgi:subtilase family serine protease
MRSIPASLCLRVTLTACLSALILHIPSQAQTAGLQHARITKNVDDTRLISLGGNTRPEAIAVNDRGPLANDLALEHMLLLLRRSPEQETALKSFVEQLHNPQSPDFHQWLTAAQFGERFGVAQQDLDTITSWLESHGFQVNVVYPNRMFIDFSGTAGQVHQAFHTELHSLVVNGVSHIANLRDPQIPEALAPTVAGIVSLHDFRPRPALKVRAQYTFSGLGGAIYSVTPGDLATIYNFNPVFNSGITGQGQTIVVIENTNLFSTNDWSTFRATFGLSGYSSASLSQSHPAPPTGSNNCGDPGINSADVEAALDAEYASAAAPSAAIQVSSCADSSTTFGGLIALQNLINASSAPPPIVSISYGECEAVNGATSNAAYYSTYQQAVTQGVSIFVASGDSGAATCDQNQGSAASGIAVSAFASTPYNVAVGGTDFGDTYANANAAYWNSGNAANYVSARSYVPEIPWNDSCANSLLAGHYGYPTYGPSSLCNVSGGFLAILSGLETTAAGGGGPSGCFSGTPSLTTPGVVSGSCAGQPKPSWQSIMGNPNDGVRDLPDVSVFAANGVWNHYYIFCFSDTANQGTACSGSPSGWTGAGGTSFGAPIMAGVQALINQKTGSRQGNPNPELYSLAASDYGAGGNASCNSSLGNSISPFCTFYDITQGDIQVDCTGSNNCYDSAEGLGVLSTSAAAYQPAYGSTTGWDFASGIGSINVANLVNAWPGTAASDFGLTASPSSVTVVQGNSSGSTISITPSNGFSGNVTLSASGLPSGVSASFNPNPTATTSALTLSASASAATGTVTVTITGTSGALTHTTTVSLTVNAAPPPPNFSLSAFPAGVTLTQGSSNGSTITVTPSNGFSGNVTLSASGLPSGVSASFNPNPTATTSALTLSASASAATGTVTVTITGTSGALTHTTTVSLTVNPAAPPPDYSLSASPNSLTIARGSSGKSTITITRLNGFTGNVTLSASGLPKNVSASFSPNPASTSSSLTLKVNRPAAIATFTVDVNGVSGGLSHSITIAVTTR